MNKCWCDPIRYTIDIRNMAQNNIIASAKQKVYSQPIFCQVFVQDNLCDAKRSEYIEIRPIFKQTYIYQRI